MILGIGTDLVRIDRIEKLIEKYGQSFLDRTFTKLEQERSDSKSNRMGSYASRFAAKEACAKALGTGIGEHVRFKDIEIKNLPSGQPIIDLSGPGLVHLQNMTPEGQQAHLYLSLSDVDLVAMATVIIESHS